MAVYVSALKLLLLIIAVFSKCILVLCHDAMDGLIFEPMGHSHIHFGEAKPTRYLLYDINPGEGFNLRRDVYMRVANLVRALNEDEPWTLVLPPWVHLYHWQTRDLKQSQIPWSTFFDLPSLNRHIPVMEFEDYVRVMGEEVVEEVYYLQRYEEGWTDGKWEEKMDIRDCVSRTNYYEEEKGVWRGWFYDYDDMYAGQFKCMSIQGHAGILKPFLMNNTTARSVFLDRAEEVIHGIYSEFSPVFWTARRSMRFAKHLRKLGDEFREKFLDSTDDRDKTVLEDDWTKVQNQHGEAVGGPYIGVHLRRKDYLRAHPDNIPSLEKAAKQIAKKLEEHKLKTVFIATDAPKQEFEKLQSELKNYKVLRYEPSSEVLNEYKDGGMAIIDQWICAHARYFIGSHVSTFSFRIQEEREILGFNPEATFNCLCGDDEPKCEQPSKWTILYS